MGLESTLIRAWLRRGPLACALWPVSLLFRALSALRRLLFRAGVLKSARLPVPVVVVGNIFIGGTGKTPLTIWLVEALRAAGMKPGVVSRGFGSSGEGARAVTALSSPAEVGDEPVLIAARTGVPVMVSRVRAEAGRALLAAHPEVDVIVTDDGLQHYALQRDVEVVLFDGRGAGNGWTLPAGPLREPPSRRRDFTVINAPELAPALLAAVAGQRAADGGASLAPMDGVEGALAAGAAPTGTGGAAGAALAGAEAAAKAADLAGAGAAATAVFQMRLAGDVAERLGDRTERVALAELARRGGKIVAAAGIGNPGRFFAMLRAAGLQIDELPLPDHHDFQDRPFASLQADLILMTEKDAVKCSQIEELRTDPRLWVVPVSARIDSALARQIVEKCRGRTFA
ncbi:tetraacyldisaccharide 4'-kinase [Pseudoduganella rhizocola]|uniref:tetraacyldisaccharide 4'-kinase n=1 Tax=Pseudoduganella rhizocola TaxID=3382643 RepID=UPI0038B595B1